MDLSTLDATILSEGGVTMILKHPVTREATDIELVVKGTESIKVKTALEKFRRISDDPRKSEKEKENAIANVLTACIIDIKNATYGDREITSSIEDIRFFVKKFSWAGAQIIEFINDLENFLPEYNSN